jgi:hypothetical protein
MFDKKSLLLFVSCWLLLAVLFLPSGASAVPDMPGSDTRTTMLETFPLLENQFPVRQAHLAYLAAKEEVGMQETIRYLESRNGSKGTLSSLLAGTEMSALALSKSGSEGELDRELENLRSLARSFRDETDLQMTAASGNPEELRIIIQAAVERNRNLEQLTDRYWLVREKSELASFDQRVLRARVTLGNLSENEYEITPAQEKLKEIVTMRSELASALRTRNNAGIELAHKKIHTTSLEYARIARDLRSMATEDSRLSQTIEQGIGVMTRSGMVNANLTHGGIDVSRPEKLVALGKGQVLAARNQVRNGDIAGARASLLEFRETLESLRDTYREILADEDLPQATAQGVLSVARSLDVTAAQTGVV